MLGRVLLVDDDPELGTVVHRVLEDSCQVTQVYRGVDLLDEVSKEDYDLVLLDINLPDTEGFELVESLRKRKAKKELPVFFLTSRKELPDKIKAFDLGADDFITKPFENAELKARIVAKIKKENSKETQMALNVGRINVILPEHRVLVQEGQVIREVSLSVQEFRMLVLFLRNLDSILTRDRILSEIWGHGSDVLDRTVDQVVCRLRTRLGGAGLGLESVRGVGYRCKILN